MYWCFVLQSPVHVAIDPVRKKKLHRTVQLTDAVEMSQNVTPASIYPLLCFIGFMDFDTGALPFYVSIVSRCHWNTANVYINSRPTPLNFLRFAQCIILSLFVSNGGLGNVVV